MAVYKLQRRRAVRPSPVFLAFVAVAVAGGLLAWQSGTARGSRTGDLGVFLLVLGGWVVSLCFHEFAHAYSAYRAGDHSVEAAGYLTLNPLKYAHPLLSIVLPLFFIIQGGIGLPGGAVYLHRHAFRNKAAQSSAAAAGPAMNVAFAIVLLFVAQGHLNDAHPRFWYGLAFLGFLQVTAAVLNLLPIPGLDGWAIIEPYLSPETVRGADKIKPFGMLGVIVLLQVPSLNAAFFNLVTWLYEYTGAQSGMWQVGRLFFQFWSSAPLSTPVRPALSRRAVLAGGAALLGLTACGSGLPSGVPDVSPGRTLSGRFASRRRHTDVGWSLNYPPGRDGERLRVLVALHGRGGDHTDAFAGSLQLDRYLAAAVGRRGTRPFAIASVDGGDHAYWHPRADGDDPAGMVIDEFLPLLARQGLDTSRVGFLGWSMGGYGALYLSTVLRASRVAVAVAESPAIWHHGYQSVAGAFDDAADFAAHSIWGRQAELRGIALRVDCGASDGFAPVTRDLRASLRPTPAGGIEAGGHDSTYWRSQSSAQLAFVGAHLPP